MARWSSPTEKPPSKRVLMAPWRSMTKVHGSVRSLQAASCGRRPLLTWLLL
jgi:hypothetical protein